MIQVSSASGDIVNDFHFLNEFGSSLNSAETEEQSLYILGQALSNLIPEVCVFISCLDPACNLVRFKKIYGIQGEYRKLLKSLGVNPVKENLDPEDLPESVRTRYASGKLFTMERGLYELFHYRVSEENCLITQQDLDIHKVMCMGFTINGQHKGGVHLLMRHKHEINNISLVESIVKQTAIAIDRQRVEKALKESETRYRELVEKSGLPIAIDSREGILTYYNEEFLQLFGYSQEEMLAQDHKALCHPEDLERIKAIHRARLLGEPAPDEYEFRGIRKDGKIIWLLIKSTLVVQNGDIVGTRSYFWNITERKMTELALKKAKEKAEESDRLKSAFLQNLSHEIRTPLNGLIGFSSLMEDKDDLSDEEKTKYCRIINQSGDHLLRIIEDIIDISRLESHQVPVHFEPIQVSSISKKIRAKFMQMCQDKNLEFKTIIDPEIPEQIITDGDKLLRIISILISNAIKFTQQGHVFFKLRKDPELDNHFRFEIEDTGCGISNENLDLVFDRFTKEDQGSSIRHGGTGLGLSIAKELSQLIEGKLGVKSTKSVGSLFHCSIPLK